MSFDDLLANGKPQATTAQSAVTGSFHPVKPIEKERQMMGRYAWPRIHHTAGYFHLTRDNHNVYLATKLRVTNRVV
jgi:hypothetical protein